MANEECGPCGESGPSRRRLLGTAAAGTAAVWAAPSILRVDAAAAASCLPCAVGTTSRQLLTAQPETTFSPSPGPCVVQATATTTVCRASTTQTMVLSSDAGGLVGPYFDELAVLTITSPTAAVSILNIIRWQADCKDPAGTDIAITGSYASPSSSPADITAAFGNECGDFTVAIEVRNAFSPYAWRETFVVAV
jgi:hypothetical protein